MKMALWITEQGRDSKKSLVKSPGTGPAFAPLPKSHSSATQRAVLAKDGISQLSAPRDADPGSPGKVQGTRGVHGQILALCWELGQPWRSEVCGWLDRQRTQTRGSWSRLTPMMAEFCLGRWRLPSRTSNPSICQRGRLCQKRFCTF